jgi:hypothetical protein
VRQRVWCCCVGRGGITMTELEQTKYCEKCESMQPMYFSKNFVIMGCRHKPYRGKWVAEIDKCPRDDYQEWCRRADDD